MGLKKPHRPDRPADQTDQTDGPDETDEIDEMKQVSCFRTYVPSSGYYDSRGSLAETKSHLIYGHQTRYFDKKEFVEYSNLIEEIWKELNSIINSLSKKL